MAPSSSKERSLHRSQCGSYCNNFVIFDLNDRSTQTTDTYGIVSTTTYDFAGHALRAIANYGDGLYSSANPDQDLITTSAYDAAGRVTLVTTPTETGHSARTASTSYDNLDRVIKITNPDSSWIKTVYTAAGRIDRASSTGASGAADSTVAWTKSVYDAAGRQTATLANYDEAGNPQLQLTTFETGTNEAFVAAAQSPLITAGATKSVSTTTAHIGTTSLQVVTTATADEGVSKPLTGTFSPATPTRRRPGSRARPRARHTASSSAPHQPATTARPRPPRRAPGSASTSPGRPPATTAPSSWRCAPIGVRRRPIQSSSTMSRCGTPAVRPARLRTSPA